MATYNSNTGADKRSPFVAQALQRKQAALQAQESGYAPLPNNIGRDFLPRIVAQDKRNRDAIVLYVYLLAHVNGQAENPRYMSAWPTVEKIAEDTGIDKNRLTHLCRILTEAGILATDYIYSLNKREKLYYPLYTFEGERINYPEETAEVAAKTTESAAVSSADICGYDSSGNPIYW
jgi:uncharacterized protein related to proFAR isomerase